MKNIPRELLSRNNEQYDVNIIIGENGSGKSFLLNEIAKSFVSEGKTVIAVATSVHDKFNIKKSNFHFFGGRLGRNMVSKVIKKSLHYVKSSNEDFDRVRSLTRVLHYIGYESHIGVKIGGFKPSNIAILEHLESVFESEKQDLLYLLQKYHDIFTENEIVSINLDHFMSNINSSALSAIVRHESEMKKLKILKNVAIYLEKKEAIIELNNASSGELMILSALMHIASAIDLESVILIDEPENSLHPKWQREYIDKILDLFYLYRPKVIIATHSPLVIPNKTQQLNIYRIDKDNIAISNRDTRNNEEILCDVFDVITPENRYLSDNLIGIINEYELDKISHNNAIRKINEYKEKIYDIRQNAFLEGVIDIIEKIKKTKELQA